MNESRSPDPIPLNSSQKLLWVNRLHVLFEGKNQVTKELLLHTGVLDMFPVQS